MIQPLNLSKLKVFPLAQRESLTRVEEILLDPEGKLPPCSEANLRLIETCAEKIVQAKKRGASVMLIYGAHLLRNGAARILDRMMASGWLTHLATNGAGTIHDWEYAWFGASTEKDDNSKLKFPGPVLVFLKIRNPNEPNDPARHDPAIAISGFPSPSKSAAAMKNGWTMVTGADTGAKSCWVGN